MSKKRTNTADKFHDEPADPVNPADPGTNDAAQLSRLDDDGAPPPPTADAFVPKDPPVTPDPVPDPPGDGVNAMTDEEAENPLAPIEPPLGRIAQSTRDEERAMQAQKDKRQ
jgi:hypothetical protein